MACSASLFFDTAGYYCCSALFDDTKILAQKRDYIGKGHAEALAPQCQRLLQESEISFEAIKEIFVNIGPGSFTGIRVGVAFARSLALAINRPVYGITCLEALAMKAQDSKEKYSTKKFLTLLYAYPEHYYGQFFCHSLSPIGLAKIFSIDDILQESLIQKRHDFFIISQKEQKPFLEERFAQAKILSYDWPDVADFQKIAKNYKKNALKPHKALPLYLRGAI